jgi:hypothetical protein
MIGERPFNIHDPENGRRLVRRVVAGESPGGELFDAVITLASGGRIDWDVASWQELLDDLDSTDATVSEWLAARHTEEVTQ